jgi:putative hydrolase of the HAD superfamily
MALSQCSLVPVVPAPEDIDAVVFDIGGVFAIRHPIPVRRAMLRAGFVLPSEDRPFHEAHFRAARHLAEVSLDGLNENDQALWALFEGAYFKHLGVETDRIAAAVQAMREEVYLKEAKPLWNYLLTDNIEGFHRVASARPVAIVSNNDGTAVEQMQEFGVCQVGPGPLPSAAIIVDSGILGIAKPDPAIFLPALQALGTDAMRTLYVGDTVHADVRGARAAGMPVVQLDPYELHRDFDHWCLPNVDALANYLEGK